MINNYAMPDTSADLELQNQMILICFVQLDSFVKEVPLSPKNVLTENSRSLEQHPKRIAQIAI